MTTDRDRRLIRARTRVAVAHQCLKDAGRDLGACEPGLNVILEKRASSLLWLCREIGRAMERAEEGAGDAPKGG